MTFIRLIPAAFLAALLLLAGACRSGDHRERLTVPVPPLVYYHSDAATSSSYVNIGGLLYFGEQTTTSSLVFVPPLLTLYGDSVAGGYRRVTFSSPLYGFESLSGPGGNWKGHNVLWGIGGEWVRTPSETSWNTLLIIRSSRGASGEGNFWLFPVLGVYDSGFFTPLGGYTNDIVPESKQNKILLSVRDDLAKYGEAVRRKQSARAPGPGKPPLREAPPIKMETTLVFSEHWHSLLLLHGFRKIVFTIKEDSSLDQIRSSGADTSSLYFFPLFDSQSRPANGYHRFSVLWPLFSTARQGGEREWRFFHFLRLGGPIDENKMPAKK